MQPAKPLGREPAEEIKKIAHSTDLNCAVIALGANKQLEKGDIISHQGSYGMAWPPISSYKDDTKPEFLYIITKELPIEDGDWFYDEFLKEIRKCTENIVTKDGWKVIAATDKSLELPGIINDLIITFIRMDGKITNIQAEMTVFNEQEPQRMIVVPFPTINPRWKEWDSEKTTFKSKPKVLNNYLVITTFL